MVKRVCWTQMLYQCRKFALRHLFLALRDREENHYVCWPNVPKFTAYEISTAMISFEV